MIARIYRPARNAMQSGMGRADLWLLEFEPEQPREREPLMGWTSSGDMKQQLRLTFSSKEDAIAYAERRGIAYRLAEPHAPRPQRKSYADNFRWGRIGAWTH
jgi:hypothetical protein